MIQHPQNLEVFLGVVPELKSDWILLGRTLAHSVTQPPTNNKTYHQTTQRTQGVLGAVAVSILRIFI